MIEKNCLHCNKPYPLTRSDRKYCSSNCAHKYRYWKNKPPLPVKSCVYCGEYFTPNRHDQLYCTRSCRQKKRQATHGHIKRRKQKRKWKHDPSFKARMSAISNAYQSQRIKNDPEYRQMRIDRAGIYSAANRLRPQILDKQGGTCLYCDETEGLEIEHQIPVRLVNYFHNPADINSLDNVQLVCHACHVGKTNADRKQFPYGSLPFYPK